MSLALTRWNLGWYLCIEFRIVCNQMILSKSDLTIIIIAKGFAVTTILLMHQFGQKALTGELQLRELASLEKLLTR